MIDIGVRHVRPDQVDNLSWLQHVGGERRAKSLATLQDEGCRHERALLIDTSDGPLLVYAQEIDDPQRAHATFAASEHPIDADLVAATIMLATWTDRLLRSFGDPAY